MKKSQTTQLKPSAKSTPKKTTAAPHKPEVYMPLVAEVNDPLPGLTGYVQDLVAKHTTTAKGAAHGDTDTRAWLADLHRPGRGLRHSLAEGGTMNRRMTAAPRVRMPKPTMHLTGKDARKLMHRGIGKPVTAIVRGRMVSAGLDRYTPGNPM